MRINPPGSSSLNSFSDQFIDDWNPDLSSERGSQKRSDDSLELIIVPPGGSDILDETVARVEKEQIQRDLGFSINSRQMENPETNLDSHDPDRTEVKKQPTASRAVVFPNLGDAIGGFRLISELGRGAFARVYLAQEIGLGNRHVALKISKAEGGEPQILARLQHTHIVPIHSLFDDPQSGLRLICMPYVGGANLAQVLEVAGQQRGAQSQGRSLVNALDLIGQPLIATAAAHTNLASCNEQAMHLSIDGRSTLGGASSLEPRSLLGRIPWWRSAGVAGGPTPSNNAPELQSQPARQFMQESSYVSASAWIMARLAEGLEHAHSRMLLHRDLKPSNVLVAADGTPMLLDFNLATESETDPENGEKARLGGTLPYMSPEHLDAFNPNGTTSAAEVGVRSDIYALGLILFEMVAGRHPFPPPSERMPLLEVVELMTKQRRQKAPSLRVANPETPWSLDAIVAKCLDPEPANRYRTAGEFAEELRRFLEDQPLKYTKEPSLRETVGKWARRHPRWSSISTIVPIAASLLLLIGSAAVANSIHLRNVAARLNLHAFQKDFQECQFLLNTTSGGDLTSHLALGLKKAQTAIDRYKITTPGDWDQSYYAGPLSAEERKTVREDLAELFVLQTRAQVALAERSSDENKRRKTLEWGISRLDIAEKFVPTPSAGLYNDRARYHRALGQADMARRDLSLAEKTPSKTCRDEYLLGTSDLANGKYDRAEARLSHAKSLDSNRFWAWFALGLCHYDQGRFEEAVGDFNVCTVIMPKFAWPFANCGQALAKSNRLTEAADAYSRAIELSPDFFDALVGRGLVYLELGQAAEAEADLRKAKTLSTLQPNAEAGLAEALAKLGKKSEAREIFDNVIAAHPENAGLFAARGMFQIETDPGAADADFQAARRLDAKLAMPYYGQARLAYRVDLGTALRLVDQALERDARLLDATQLRALIRARLGRVDSLNDLETLLKKPTENRLYNAACALAALAKTHPEEVYRRDALALLKRAIDAGFSSETVRNDPDFAIFATNPDFQQLVATRK